MAFPGFVGSFWHYFIGYEVLFLQVFILNILMVM